METQRLEGIYNDDSETLITDTKYGFISGALKETYKTNTHQRKLKTETEIIDTFITHKIFGFPIFVFFLWVMFLATFKLGQYPHDWIESLVALISDSLTTLLPAGFVKDLLINGIINGVGGVIVFLPNIMILFLFISFMEDSGYMARAAFIMDKLMHKIGLHGKSFIPLIMGFGCNVPAIMATRTLENRNERLLTILINPFMSCSARLPVYILIIAAFFQGNEVSMLFAVYGIGIFFAVLFAVIFNKTIFKSKEAPFVMELPPYRLPTLRSTIRHMWVKASQYLKKMGGVILVASMVIWALGYFTRHSAEVDQLAKQIAQTRIDFQIQSENSSENSENLAAQMKSELNNLSHERNSIQQKNSFIGQIGQFIQPVMSPLGFDWKMSVSLLAGVAAKEVVVSTMGVLYQTDANPDEQSPAMISKLRNARFKHGARIGDPVFTKVSAFAYLMFILLYFPCIAVVAAVRREASKWKWALFMVSYTTSVAWIVGFLCYQIGSWLLL